MAARGISNIIFSETTCLVEFLLGRNVPYMIFCKVCEFTAFVILHTLIVVNKRNYYFSVVTEFICKRSPELCQRWCNCRGSVYVYQDRYGI